MVVGWLPSFFVAKVEYLCANEYLIIYPQYIIIFYNHLIIDNFVHFIVFFSTVQGFFVPVNIRFRLRFRVVFAPFLFPIVSVSVFVSGVSVFVSVSGKKNI